jgi:acyl-[acyl-carrier-protein] desaturase
VVYEITPEDIALLDALTDETERLYNRHLESPRLWDPYMEIEWGSGRSFKTDPWSEEDYPLSAGVRSAIYVNLLTEDNLPYYTSMLLQRAPDGHPLVQWSHQWTMEEDRHAMTMRDWVHVSRCIDPALLEEGRRVQMTLGRVPEPPSIAELIVYVALQERATQVAHRNTSARLSKEDTMGRRVLGLIAGDETKHYMFYRDLVASAYLIDPSRMMRATATVVAEFAMPGTGIPRFSRHAAAIAKEGIYGLGQFTNEVVSTTLLSWDVRDVALSRDGEAARDDVRATLSALEEKADRAARRFVTSRVNS